MNKKLIISIAVLAIILVASAIYLLYSKEETSSSTTTLANPVSSLTDAQALAQFDESYVLYLLYSIKANNLHNPPLSGNTPKIEIVIDEQIFNAEINRGRIEISEGNAAEKDIIIRTTKQEIIKMLRNKNYVSESFRIGSSSIELVAGKTELLTKGYLSMYEELTGEEAEE